MDTEQEKVKLIGLLGIPITRVRLSDFFCEIFFREELVGYLPITMSPSGIQYETRAPHLKNINWPKLCNLNAPELSDAVGRNLGKGAFKIVPSSFRRLFIEDPENNLFASFTCLYRNGSWELTDEKILQHDNGMNSSPLGDNLLRQSK